MMEIKFQEQLKIWWSPRELIQNNTGNIVNNPKPRLRNHRIKFHFRFQRKILFTRISRYSDKLSKCGANCYPLLIVRYLIFNENCFTCIAPDMSPNETKSDKHQLQNSVESLIRSTTQTYSGVMKTSNQIVLQTNRKVAHDGALLFH